MSAWGEILAYFPALTVMSSLRDLTNIKQKSAFIKPLKLSLSLFLIRSIYLSKAILTLFLSASVVSCATIELQMKKDYCLKAAKLSGYKKREFSKELLFRCVVNIPAPAPVRPRSF